MDPTGRYWRRRDRHLQWGEQSRICRLVCRRCWSEKTNATGRGAAPRGRDMGEGVEADPWPLWRLRSRVTGRGGITTFAIATTVPVVAVVVASTASTMATTAVAPTLIGTGGTSTVAVTVRAWRHRGGGYEGRLRDDLGFIGDHGLLEGKHRVRPAEGREWSGVDDVVSGDRELGVQTAHEVEDELRLRDGVTDIAKRVSEGLHALTVVSDRGVTLNKSMKLVVEVDRARLLIVVEEIEDGGVKGTSRLIIGTHGEGEDGVFDRVVEPALDGVVGLRPHQIRGTCRDVWIKVGKKSELPHHGPKEGAPAGEIRAGEF
jgi:hypothetical protein